MGEIEERHSPIRLDTPENLVIGLKKASEIIFSGGLVAFPTESYYALASNPTDEKALRRLFITKKREGNRPILILVPSAEILDRYVVAVSDMAGRLIKQFWPGGLTLVFEAKPTICRLLTSGTGKIGVRLSSHPVATALAQAVGMPITGTSANISGRPACRSARGVFHSFGSSVDLILDGGMTRGGRGSTVLDITVDPPVILREGMVSREQLKQYLSTSPSP